MTDLGITLTDVDADRFWEKVDRSGGPDVCWPWTASVSAAGYGYFHLREYNVGSHRIAFVAAGGVLTVDEPQVLHHCDNPPCCNARHLFVGTHADNMADMATKGRGGSPRGERHGRAKLTKQDVSAIRKRVVAGETRRALAREFGVSHQTVNDIVNMRTWVSEGGP